jgi:hypothetical protein
MPLYTRSPGRRERKNSTIAINILTLNRKGKGPEDTSPGGGAERLARPRSARPVPGHERYPPKLNTRVGCSAPFSISPSAMILPLDMA